MEERLDGKTALVTGGTSGIGYAFAHAAQRPPALLGQPGTMITRVVLRRKLLRGLGAKVIITGRDEAKLAQAAASLEAVGVACDFRDDGWHETLAAATDGFKVDVLVNNAGYNPYLEMNSLTSQPVEVHRAFVDAMVVAYLRLSYACLPHMTGQAYGRVVNVASVASHLTSSMEPKFSMYGAAKGAVAAFSTALRRNLLEGGAVGAARNVHVTAACPGNVPTALARDAPESGLGRAHASVTASTLKWGFASTADHTAASAWAACAANRPYAFNSKFDKLICIVMHVFTLLHILVS